MKRMTCGGYAPLALVAGLLFSGCAPGAADQSEAPRQIVSDDQAVPLTAKRYPLAGNYQVVPVAMDFLAPPPMPPDPGEAALHMLHPTTERPNSGDPNSDAIRRTPPLNQPAADAINRLPAVPAEPAGNTWYGVEYPGDATADSPIILEPRDNQSGDVPRIDAPVSEPDDAELPLMPPVFDLPQVERREDAGASVGSPKRLPATGFTGAGPALGDAGSEWTTDPAGNEATPFDNLAIDSTPAQGDVLDSSLAAPAASVDRQSALPLVDHPPMDEFASPVAPYAAMPAQPARSNDDYFVPPPLDATAAPPEYAMNEPSSDVESRGPDDWTGGASESTTSWQPTSIPVEPSGDTIEDQSRQVPAHVMAAVSGRAETLTRQGVALARRGAAYSARAEFVEALRTVAMALDAVDESQSHTHALGRGLQALREADDFVRLRSTRSAEVNLAGILDGHRTPLLKDVDDVESLSPLKAVQSYYAYAQQQLSEAVGNEPSASLALYSLGRLHAAMGDASQPAKRTNAPKAMCFYQSALMVDERNYLAANELGVLLTRYGQLQDARRVLQLSASMMPTPEAWQNLATVHQRLEEHDLAELARYEQRLAQQRQLAGVVPRNDTHINWVSTEKFKQSSPPGPAMTTAAGAAIPTARSLNQPSTPKKANSWRWPWK